MNLTLEQVDEVITRQLRRGRSTDVDTVCELLGWSKAYTLRQYSIIAGETLGKRVRFLKLEFAKSRIDAGFPIDVAADDAGFDLSSLYRLFKKEYGITPAKYRRRFNSTIC